MIRNPQGNDLLVRVSEAFWNVLFSNKLVLKPIGQTWCFCLNNQDAKKQMIVVYPSTGARKLPSPVELAKRFKLRDDGRYLDIQKLPIHYLDLTGLTGVYIENISFAEKELVVLYMHYAEEQDVKFSDSVINGCEIGLTDETEEEYPWPEDPNDLDVIICSENEKIRKIHIFYISRLDAVGSMMPSQAIVQRIRTMQRMRQVEISDDLEVETESHTIH